MLNKKIIGKQILSIVDIRTKTAGFQPGYLQFRAKSPIGFFAFYRWINPTAKNSLYSQNRRNASLLF
jgi:hypothetical protein